MAKGLRYMGEFLSRRGTCWRVEILQEGYDGSVGELTFEAEEALVIEWQQVEREEVVCGSEATLTIESPGDRTYEDLYTIEAGTIRMDVYREGQLYWSGTLDPEFYEEPYERVRNYPVSLTFSDFGILDRLKYNLSGMHTFGEILSDALARSGINYLAVDAETYCTTYLQEGEKAGPDTLSLRSDNFYDEDGEPCTLEETLIGIMQPLALRMVQRNGRIWIYDLNGLCTLAPTREVVWDGEAQTMATDKVVNNVKVNFSPYSSAKLLDTELEYTDDYNVDMVNLKPAPGASYYSYYPDYGDDAHSGSEWDYNLIDFTIFLSTEGKGLKYINPAARYSHILPLTGSANETTAVAWSFRSGGHGDLASGWPKQVLNSVGKASSAVLMRTNRVFLPKLAADASSYKVRLSLEMLMDTRYNPFTDADEGNEGGNYSNVKAWTGWAFVPVGVTVYDVAGNALCHYVNRPIAITGVTGHLGYAKGTWEPGEAAFGDAWLEYYSTDDQQEDAGIQGWKANRHCVGRPDRVSHMNPAYGSKAIKLYKSFLKMGDGEYMPYPIEGGFMEVVVYTGVNCYDYGEDTGFDTTQQWDKKGLYDKIRWLLYKAPKLELVRNNLVFDEAELDDVEYTGYINKAAKEELSIDTICGTANRTCPTARGIYCRASDGLQVSEMTRAGVTDHPEKLFIGTLYSQYATRKTALSGEAVLDAGDLCCFTEQNQAGKRFLLAEDIQDVIADTSEIKIVELSPDEYEAIEEVE